MRLLPLEGLEQGEDRYREVLRNAEIGAGGWKCRELARTAMPQLKGRDTATGELAQVTGDTR
jgi:hypothetical protein